MTAASIAILGGSGYGGGELLRLLAGHPQARVRQVISRQHAGRPLGEVHRHLDRFYDDLAFRKTPDLRELRAGGPAVIFSALPNGESGRTLSALFEDGPGPEEANDGPSGLTVIDLSGDLRLREETAHAAAYPATPALAGLRARAQYGLVELNRPRLREAALIANPGCFATALQLALAPLVAAGLRGFVAADGQTGSSGSGVAPSETTHHPSRHSDLRAYKLEGHPHAAEVEQGFPGLRLSFVPHSAPLVRGIFVTLHAPVESFPNGLPDLASARAFYEREPFIRVRSGSPRVLDVAGTNFCDLTLVRRPESVVVCAALDNLGKGMAGQAIQNMNLRLGLPETTGLWQAAPGVI